MKFIKLLLVTILFYSSAQANNVNTIDIPQKIFDATKVGNAIELAKFFNSSIELILIDKEDIYSKQQAEQILKNFFDQIQIKSFTLLHQGGNSPVNYAIANIETTTGKIYRVYYLVKENTDKPLIHQLRIEEE